MVDGILSWWDGVELWLTGLGFVAQTAVVMPVVLVLAFGIAIVLDTALGYTIRVGTRARDRVLAAAHRRHHRDREPR